ncbi:MAG: hypothetical protein ABSH44_16765 [Bryobacteraceae bacterium]|jgi:hypothetical protein
MKNPYSDDHVFPRPVEHLPEYAHAKARQTCAERITEAFKLAPDAATTIANAVVDPTAVRKSIGEPTDPSVEEIAVPGGVLLGIRTSVWARRVMPDPRNPRIGPSRQHPFAIDPGTGTEDSRFRPVPEPRSPRGVDPTIAQLAVEIESREHLTWACQQATKYVLADNDWRTSIASQGVMEPVWLVVTTYEHADGSSPVTALVSAEGSSRITADHDLLSIRSADTPYEDNDSKLRNYLRKVSEALDRGPNRDESVALRCERIPALIIVGFRRHPTATTSFPTAIKSLVALRHVDPPKPWGEGPENESLADEVLDELHREGIISATERDYYAGSCTRSEARAAHLSDDPAVRAARIVRLFTSEDERVSRAIRVAVTSQSTRKRITPKLCDELATALILRSNADDPSKNDQIRRYLRDAFGKASHREPWDSTDRDVETLAADALTEVRNAIGSGTQTEPSPASLELAVRAAYPLIVSGRLAADRGSLNNAQPDRRNPGEVLDAMRRTIQGVYQLAQALQDFAANRPLRAVDEEGGIRTLPNGAGEVMINDVYLRGEFPPPGKARAPRPGDTPDDLYHNCIGAFTLAIEQLEQAFLAIGQVLGNDGRPLVEDRGVDAVLCGAWRDTLARIDDELAFWGRRFKQIYGIAPGPAARAPVADDEGNASETDDSGDADDLTAPASPLQ